MRYFGFGFAERVEKKERVVVWEHRGTRSWKQMLEPEICLDIRLYVLEVAKHGS